MIEYEIGTKYNDVLTKEVIKSWKGENVILNGATGTGKTYFMEHNLHKYASTHFKSILYLCNRTALYQDVKMEIDIYGYHSITPMLYQTVQARIFKGEPIMEHYDYIVCDEFHYVTCDSMFNIYTDLVYDWILNQTNSTKIFMSGTASTIFNKLKSDGIVKEEFIYKIPYDYSYVTETQIFNKNEDVYNIINNLLINTDDKIIYFANSLDNALDVYLQFKKYAHFRCSEHVTGERREEALQYNDTECIKTHSKDNCTFNNRLLITTKCLDNGININDRQVKHIVCDVFDLESHQQCLGRKRRLDKDDTCTFYIRNYNKKAIGQFKGGLNTKLNPLQMFVKDQKQYNIEYDSNRKFHSNFIYHNNSNGIREYNHLAYWKMLAESVDIELMEMKGNTYATILLSNLGDTITNVIDLQEMEDYKLKDELEIYLDDLIGKWLYKDEQKELINKINLTDSRNRQQKSLKMLNQYLIDNNLSYTIVSDTDYRRKLDDGTDNPVRTYTRVQKKTDVKITEFDGEGLISPRLAGKLEAAGGRGGI